MVPEPKPQMRQIAELIDGIATARAESAEKLLTMCEHQLALARRDTSDLRSILDDQAHALDERDAQIERVKALLDSAISDCIDRDAEIARLKAELAAALAANPTAPTTAVEVPRPATATEIRTYMDKLADQPRTGGYVPPPAPPADDPRIAALCNLVGEMYRAIRHAHSIRHDPADLETIAGRR